MRVRGPSIEPGQPFRGGIPICWPWFSNETDDPAEPQHGFARTRFWTLTEAASGSRHRPPPVPTAPRRRHPRPLSARLRSHGGHGDRRQAQRDPQDQEHRDRALSNRRGAPHLPHRRRHRPRPDRGPHRVPLHRQRARQAGRGLPGQAAQDRGGGGPHLPLDGVRPPARPRPVPLRLRRQGRLPVHRRLEPVDRALQEDPGPPDRDYREFVCIETANAAKDHPTSRPTAPTGSRPPSASGRSRTGPAFPARP